MNYHIINIKDKFFHEYIEDIYRLHAEDNNVVWMCADDSKSTFFETNRPIEYIGHDFDTILQKLLLNVRPGDKLFISWYDTFMGKIILASKLTNPLYVWLLGAEFYSQPEWWHVHWLLDKYTRRKVVKQDLLPRFFPKGKPWRWYRCINWFKFKKELQLQYQQKLETIKRIDYIVITEHSGSEIELVKRLYPTCRAQHAVCCFDQNFDLAQKYDVKPIPAEGESISILFGNSADPNGNHIDALRYIQNHIKDNVEVFSFLSYGRPDCRKWTIEYAKQNCSFKFTPIIDYMSRDEFVHTVWNKDVVMMYHNRQQAEGNIMTALVLGKPVFMKPRNPQFDMLKRMGILDVYDVEDMHKVDLREAISLAQQHRTNTIAAIEKEYSRASRLTNLRKLIC